MTPWRRAHAALLVIALAGAACSPSPEADRTAADRLLPDTGGPIQLALVVVASPRRSALRNQQMVESIVRRLGPRARLLVLADREMVLDPNPWPQRMEFVEIPDGLDFTIWPQDPFVVLQRAVGAPRLLVSRGYAREQDREMARVTARVLGWESASSALYFAGGNVLSDERTAFLGADLIGDNAVETGRPEAEIVKLFEEELGLPVLVVGRSPQLMAHLDMLFTPLGARRVAVADSELGAALAEAALAGEPESVRAFEQRAEEQFFGHEDLKTLLLDDGRTIHRPGIVGGTRGAIAYSRAVAGELHAMARELTGLGYAVVRIPLLLTSAEGKIEPEYFEGGRDYPSLSYNNVLVERVDDKEKVFIAEYGFATLDQAARRAWQAAGFEVHGVAHVTTSAIYRGSLRCSVKVLQRGG